MSGIIELLRKKRSGNELSSEDIAKFVNLTVTGTAEDSQIGAMLMAMFINGLTNEETIALTKSMVDSGETLSWRPEDIVVDKHSTGGVGDKVSIPLVPALAACGLKVPMVSGRGLDFSGGTLDKLESIPGYQVNCSTADLKAKLSEVGCFIVGANKQLSPGDQILYRVRDVTATVDNLSLCSASILSKKVAEGTKYLVIDVKVGEASFFKTYEKAKEMAELLVRKIKNLRRLLLKQKMEIKASFFKTYEKAKEMAELLAFPTLISFHVICFVSTHLYPHYLLFYNFILKFYCFYSAGVVEDINGIILAKVTHALGAGRTFASQPINHSVGVRLTKTCGDFVVAGEVWVEVHHSQPKESIQSLLYDIEHAITIREDPSSTDHGKLVLEVVM
ncbi:thymidine phosphorylase-like [Diaphorina citri]|uniref:Thymidine phosphorylase-like n=1 Tax=Diaphorina citri TaxID=121845 RepID=A0A3Q0IM16_DIACI|nr:thymidine phosphorylase-like [Diaphorina citri]